MKLTLVGLFFSLLSSAAMAESCPMSSDGDFVLDPWSANNSYANGVSIQSDSKIVIAGYAGNGVNCSAVSCMAIARYDEYGCADASFGSGGLLTSALGGNKIQGHAIAMQADGKFLVAGSTYGTDDNLSISRVTTSGALDSTFNGSGWNSLDISGRGDFATAVGVQTLGANAGKVIAAGGSYTTTAFSTDTLVVRFKANGALDTTKFTGFGGGSNPKGYILSNVKSSAADYIEGIAIQSDDKIVGAGYWSNSTSKAITLVRYTDNGVLDSSFGSGGIVLPNLGGSSVKSEAHAVALQSDGKIVIVGDSDQLIGSGGTNALLVARFNTNGTLDTAGFNSPSGYRLIDVSAGNPEHAQGVVIQADGKIVVAGYSGAAAVAVRVETNGTLDATFGTGGIKSRTSPTVGENLWAQAVALMPGGDILTAGTRNTGSSTSYQPFVLRFWH